MNMDLTRKCYATSWAGSSVGIASCNFFCHSHEKRKASDSDLMQVTVFVWSPKELVIFFFWKGQARLRTTIKFFVPA